MDRDQWLAQVKEDVVEPELPICDPHHHLWDHPGRRYLLEELLADTGSGHNVVATVFVECMSMYRADGPEGLRPVGETEFVNGVAAMSRSGRYGPTRVAAGIVSFADLTLGERAGEGLDADGATGPHTRGRRHDTAWAASVKLRNPHANPRPGFHAGAAFRRGSAELRRRGLPFDACLYHPQFPEVTRRARAFPDTAIILDHF